MSLLVLDGSAIGSRAETSEPAVHIVQGRKAIVGMQDVLAELCERCGQAGAMDDLDYYLTRPALKKTPNLMLISNRANLGGGPTKASDLLGAVILYEYKIGGIHTGTYATDDSTGRRALVAPAELRGRFAALICKWLVEAGAQTVLVTFRGERGVSEWSNPKSQFRQTVDAWGPVVAMSRSKVKKTVVERVNLGYLPIASSFEETLAKLGKRTRTHMRSFRRRAEQELGCTFHTDAKISREEFMELNRRCMFAVSNSIAAWRYDSAQQLRTPFMVGIRGRDGRWLSMAGGRLVHGVMELKWQMNLSELAAFSLGTVMRSYLLENGVGLGATEFFIEGGTNHSMRNAFVNEWSTDVLVQRHSLTAFGGAEDGEAPDAG